MRKKNWTSKYRGITHPYPEATNKFFSKWKKTKCRKDMHLFDEYASSITHCLVCDACGLCVHIDRIEDK